MSIQKIGRVLYLYIALLMSQEPKENHNKLNKQLIFYLKNSIFLITLLYLCQFNCNCGQIKQFNLILDTVLGLFTIIICIAILLNFSFFLNQGGLERNDLINMLFWLWLARYIQNTHDQKNSKLLVMHVIFWQDAVEEDLRKM